MTRRAARPDEEASTTDPRAERPGSDPEPRTSGGLRAHNRVRLLRAVHDTGARRTRSQLTRTLALSRGTVSVLVAGLAEDALLDETPTQEHTRGRPTGIPGPHPYGPLALAVDLREDSWDLAVCELGGSATIVRSRTHDGTPEGALLPLAAAVRERLGPRTVGVGVSVAGPVRAGGVIDIPHLDWWDVDVAAHMRLGDVPLHIANDARLAGLAEARRGRLHGVRLGVHLHVAFDLGGALVVDGRPLSGASGTTGEYGHMPLGGGRARCRCGARGCWGMAVGGNALLRHLGLAAGGGRGWDVAEGILREAAEAAGRPAAEAAGKPADAGTDARTGSGADSRTGSGTPPALDPAAALAAVRASAHAFGSGIGALVNGLDPDAVTLSGLGVELHSLAGDTLHAACQDSLMAFRRSRPVRVLPSSLGRRGPLTGAMEAVFDGFLTTEGLGIWQRPPESATASDSSARPGRPATPASY
ncbi:ROK family protein [Streptomyces oceani]|uniref:ROK family protein n=1 Tax=Streptomyces oceani TaxID=1075402 RepID=UPI0009A0C592|nr:ROK family protein [Streptomyces oceani]